MAASLFSTTKNKLIFAASWLTWTAGQFLSVVNDWELGWKTVLIDTLSANILLGAIVLLVINNLRYYRPQKGRYFYLVVLCGVLSALWGSAVRVGLAYLLGSDEKYRVFLDKSMPGRFDIAFLITGCAAMISMLWYNLAEQKEQEQRKEDAEKLAKDAELYKLRQQLQPHFLFNSLNSISALIGTQPQQARRMIQQLSDFLRGTIKKEEHQWVSLQDELQLLQLYLDIEKVRFGHRLNTEITCDETGQEALLPAMLLQPLVENAIKFGLYDTTESITIRIVARIAGDYLEITVENPFDPETSSPKRGTGFGLSSVQRRLYLLFGRNDLVTADTRGHLFITTVKIPQHDKGIDH